MNKNTYKNAFTLVELIVVITILAVLATVAFISFQGYAANSRDSVRLTDMKNIEKIISISKQTTGKYPLPNDNTNITYSGSTAWTQGVFGQNAYSDTISMSNIPTDPLTLLPYAYSVTNTRQEYQLAAVLEGIVSNIHTQTYAGDKEARIYIKGNYNGKIIKVTVGPKSYLLGVPSILTSDITSVDMMDIINNQKLVYKGYNNLPASYSGSQYNSTPINGFNFSPNQVILFEGDTSDLESNQGERKVFFDKLKTNYNGSIISGEGDITELLNIDSNSDIEINNYTATILNNTLKTNIPFLNKTEIASEVIVPEIETNKVYSTLNFDFTDKESVYGNGDIRLSGIGYKNLTSSIGHSTGKWFWEYTYVSGGAGSFFGIANKQKFDSNIGVNLDSYGYNNWYKVTAPGNASCGSVGLSSGQVIGVALNLDDNEVSYYSSSTLLCTRSIEAGKTWYAMFAVNGTSAGDDGFFRVNFGTDNFSNTVPAGYNEGLYNNVPINAPRSCKDILDKGLGTVSGVYSIYANETGKLTDVYCDMVTDGGGWTLVAHSASDGNYISMGLDYNSCLLNPTLGACGNYTLPRKSIVGTSYMKKLNGMPDFLIAKFSTSIDWYSMGSIYTTDARLIHTYYANNPSVKFAGYGADIANYTEDTSQYPWYKFGLSNGNVLNGGLNTTLVYISGNLGGHYSGWNKSGVLYVR